MVAESSRKMPLESGKSQATISKNIATERRAHPSMDPKQAAAIAYSKARGDAMGKLDKVADAVASLVDRIDSMGKRRAGDCK
jgi:hypothetical protein